MIKYLLYITIPSLFVLASIVWLIIAAIRRSRSFKWAAYLVLIEALIMVGGYFYYLTPNEYLRNYLGQPNQALAGLGELASSRNFYLGGAIGNLTNPHVKALVPKEFNSITPENATKFRQLLDNEEIGKYDFGQADVIVNYGVERGVRVRGHTLVWGKFSGKTYPKALDGIIANASDPQAKLRQIMRDHITTTLNHFRGRISTWDVVNEPLSMEGPYLDKNIYLNTLGKSYIAEAFRIAHEVDPSIQLYINEQFGKYTGEGVEVFFDLLEWLIDEKVPLHGVGIQAHSIFKTHNLDEFRGFIERVTDLGLKFEITEFDARIRLFHKADDPYQAQADYMAEYARICIENPMCTGFTFWGLSDKHTWFDYVPPFKWMLPNDPMLFDLHLQPKPAYAAIRESLELRPN